MRLHEIKHGNVYLYNDSCYVYIYPDMSLVRPKLCIRLNCLNKHFHEVSDNFALSGDFEEVTERISERVKSILGVVDIKEKLFPIY